MTSPLLYDTYDQAGILLVDVSGTGPEVRAVCPQCSGTRKGSHRRERDLAINLTEGLWVCHHCGWRGALRRGASPGGPPFPAPAPAVPYQRAVPTPAADPDAVAYWTTVLDQRGINRDDYDEATFATMWCGGCGKEQPLMILPYVVNGEVLNHKYRCPDKHFWMDKGAERTFFNLDRIDPDAPIIIVEGEMDVFALRTALRENAISVPDGAPPPGTKTYSSKFTFLERAEDLLRNAARVVIAVDGDEPGEVLRDELVRRIGYDRCAVVRWPDGLKDANQVLLTLGHDKLRALVDDAQPLPARGVYTGLELQEPLERLYRAGGDRGVPIGFPTLDKIYRPTPGHITVVTGHAGSGKSTVLDNFAVQLAVRYGAPTAFFSPEQQPTERHQLNLIEIYCKQAALARAGVHEADIMSLDRLRTANEFLARYISFINPEAIDEEPSLDRILELASTEVYRRGIRYLVIDPFNEVEHNRPRQYTETEYVSMFLSRFRRWCRDTGVHGFLVAHPKKLRAEDGKDAMPGLGDISGSNHFRNKTDYGLVIHRDQQEMPNMVSIFCVKARWRDSAEAPRRAVLQYDPRINVIHEPR